MKPKVYAEDRGCFPTLLGEIIADKGLCIPKCFRISLVARSDYLIDLVVVSSTLPHGYIMPVGRYEDMPINPLKRVYIDHNAVGEILLLFKELIPE